MKKKKFLTFAALAVVFAAAAGFGYFRSVQQKRFGSADVDKVVLEDYKDVDFLISADELEAMLGSDDLLLFDCNNPKLYKAAHIPGAVGIGMHAFSDTTGKPGDPGWGTILPKEKLAAKLNELGITGDKTVVFYSNVFKGPGADGRAVWQLKLAGLDNVKFLMGGLSKWQAMGKPVTDEVSNPVPSEGIRLKDYDLNMIATGKSVYEHLGKEVLIDVRTRREFDGSQNAGEPRGGHIAGAEFMLWHDVLNADGTPKPKAEIKKILASYNVQPEDDFTLY